MLLLSLFCYRYTLKPALITVLLLSAGAAYHMDTYNIIIDSAMIDNILKTDAGEVRDLLTAKLALYGFLLGVLPSILVLRAPVAHGSLLAELISRWRQVGVALGLIALVLLAFGSHYASFFREHKPLRMYANPAYFVYSLGKYAGEQFKHDGADQPLRMIAEDAHIPASDEHRELIIMVVGEAARADRLSLNGYARETNPLLAREELISFTDFWSCGTSTAISVPCMFSNLGSAGYSKDKASAVETILDILQNTGVNVLWLDNNSDSKGVALRVPYESYKTRKRNTICDKGECRDEGMLLQLQSYIDAHSSGDIFVVLHQMGNHGPAYYKRYPAEFERFTPVCQSSQLDECSKEEIGNAYDNAILYTDYFLSRVIALLKDNELKFESAMLYVSDHGESLGVNGLYLHGMPNVIAPDEQRHVPVVIWVGDSFDMREDVGYAAAKAARHQRYTHDNLFHTLLGLMEVETSIYRPDMDLLRHED